MPRFKTTVDIFLTKQEYFDHNWMDSNKVIVPPKKDWTYDREMQIEDVDLWEVIWEASGGYGVFVSYLPFAEFWMVTNGWGTDGITPKFETFYGPGSELKVRTIMNKRGWTYSLQQYWVDEDKAWIYRK